MSFSEVYKALNKELAHNVDSDHVDCYTDTVAFIVRGNGTIHHCHSYVCFGWTGNRSEYRFRDTTYLAFHIKAENLLPEEVCRGWLGYICEESPWREGISNTPEDILSSRYVLGNASAPSNVMYGALFCTRMMYERPQFVYMWHKLVEGGVAKDTAFLLMMSMTTTHDPYPHYHAERALRMSDDMKEITVFPGQASHSDHMPLYLEGLSKMGARNFYSQKIEKLVEPINHRDFQGIMYVCAMFSGKNESTRPLLEFIREVWAVDKKPKSNNPFLSQVSMNIKASYAQAIQRYIEIAPAFEKEFKPQ